MNRICKKCKKDLNEKSFTKDKKQSTCDNCFKVEQIQYDIRVETLLPTTLTYRITAESPEKAIELLKFNQPVSIKYRLREKKDIKLAVYNYGCSVILFIKNLLR